jgi:hypothetical protein
MIFLDFCGVLDGFFYFIGARPKNQCPSLTFCYNHMLNVRQIHFLCRITHQCWYYLSVLEFYDLGDLLVRYDWLNIIIKVAAPPCT